MTENNENSNNSIKIDAVSQAAFYRSTYHDKPKTHLMKNITLMGSIAFIVIALFFIAYLYQTSAYYDVTHKYLNTAKLYISEKSSWIIDKTNGLRESLTKKSPQSQDKNIALAELDSSVQLEYYKAMSLLNEGLDEQALINLQAILKRYPEFEPAKNLYAALER